MQRGLKVSGVVTALDHPALWIDSRPGLTRVMEEEIESCAKILPLLIVEMVDHLQDRPLLGRRLPAGLFFSHSLHEALNGFRVFRQSRGEILEIHHLGVFSFAEALDPEDFQNP
jgi:hypothetical protein